MPLQPVPDPVPVFMLGPNPEGQDTEALEETKSHIDHSYIEAYSAVDVSNESVQGQLQELKTETNASESEGEHNDDRGEIEDIETKPNVSQLGSDLDDLAAKGNETMEISIGSTEADTQDKANESLTNNANVELNMEVWDEQNASTAESVLITCDDGFQRTGMCIIFCFGEIIESI